MPLQTTSDLCADKEGTNVEPANISESIYSQDYAEFLNEAGWRLEKKLPSNSNNYSDLLEDTEWKSNEIGINTLKHYRRDLDALS